MTERLSAAVVVCTASHDRSALLRACVQSLLSGSRVPDEVLVIVDHKPSLLAELAGSLPASVRLLQTERQGLSEARNVGLEAASSDIVAFIDDDAIAGPVWLASLMDAFEAQGDILGAGGPALPRWGADRRWMPDELLWVVGCTYHGHREIAGPIRNPLGCNMAFRRQEVLTLGGFATSFGKRGNALETCDETELSLRLESAHGPGRILYIPAARVRHLVPAARISWQLLLRRSLSEGLSKARLDRLYGRPALGPERTYARSLVVETVPRLLVTAIARREGKAVLGAAAIVVSLLVTGAAFVVGAARARHGHGPSTGSVRVAR
jgi:GT2 family glycosyltransferase